MQGMLFLVPFYFIMKIISLNIRGVGKDGKKEWMQDICRVEYPCVLALQETKSKGVEGAWVEEIWGNKNFNMLQTEARGRFGCLLLVWDKGVFSCTQKMVDDMFIAVKGSWFDKDSDVILVNIYGPQFGEHKMSLWSRLADLINS